MYTEVHVPMHLHTEAGGRRQVSYHFPHYSVETGSLTRFEAPHFGEALLLMSFPDLPVCDPKCWVCRHLKSCLAFIWVLEFCSYILMFTRQVLSLLSHSSQTPSELLMCSLLRRRRSVLFPRCWKLITNSIFKCLFCIYRKALWISSFIWLLWWTNWLLSLELTLHSCDEFNLVMFWYYLLLDWVCWNFWEGFYVYIHKEYWFIVFLYFFLILLSR